MRLVQLISLTAVAIALGSCTGTGINDKNAYDVISGKTQFKATVTDASQVPTSVAFTIDGNPIPNTQANGSTFTVDFDTSTVSNGVHFVKAVGQPGDVELLNNSIFVQNTGVPATGGAAAPAGTAQTGTTP